jgi:RHS repeat-associated protein
MKHTAAYAAYTIVVLLILASVLSAQGPAIGTPPLGSFGGGPFDVINLGNLNVHFTVPILHKAGRGMPFAYDLTYDSSVWYPGSVSGVQTWQPVAGYWGWHGLNNTNYTNTNYSTLYTSGNCGQLGQNTWQSWQYSHLVYTDQTGNHPFPYGSSFIQTNGTTNCPTPGPNPSTTFITNASDNSGLTATVQPPIAGSISANINNSSGTAFSSGGSYGGIDANGNQITSSGGVYTDTLGQSTLTVAGVPPSNTTFTYTAPSGATPNYAVSYKSYTVKTNFGCSGIVEYNTAGIYLVDKITLPDGTFYQFQYEPTAGGTSGQVTGRLASVSLPTGGSIAYIYAANGTHNGINCADGSAPVASPSITRTVTPGGNWTYARSGSGTTWGTTITDPNSNQTLINFSEDASLSTNNFYETWRNVYQGSSTSGTSLMTFDNCWNANFSNCATQAVYSPISRQDYYTFLPNGSSNIVEAYYNSYGLVIDKNLYNWGQVVTQETTIAYASLGNGIVDHPSSVTVTDASGDILSKTTYAYDGSAVTATSGTPQHLSVTGSRGNLTTITNYTSASGGLSKTLTYYDTGNMYQATDVNGAVTTYVYGTAGQGNSTVSCGNSFPTQINLPLSLSTSTTWNCVGGVATVATDANGNSTTTTYNDPDFWRSASVQDPTTATTSFKYTDSTSSSVESSMLFNSNSSIAEQLSTLDGFGRVYVSQRQQGPGATNYDSTQTVYDALGRPSKVTMPYVGTVGQTNSGTPGTTTVYDALGRVTKTTDGGTGYVSYTYSQNDVLQTRGPAPSGENTKSRQMEYDGLGRLTSVCELTQGTGNGACGQTNAYNGYLTTYAYGFSSGHNTVTVTQNAQASSAARQTRTYSYDQLGRLVSESNPESGTVSYAYDAFPSGCYNFGDNQTGNLTGKTDANGNTICPHSDALHRVLDVGYSGPNSTSCKRFRYDASTNGVKGSAPSGVTVSNVKGQLMEVETDNCGAWPPTPITDEWFSYSLRGDRTDVYESTPHSGTTYYHTTAGYWANGALESLSSNITGVPTQTYGVDGEGRPYSVTAATGQNPVASTTYNLSTYVATVNFGSLDSDVLTFDPNTGRMKQYTFNVGSKADTGVLAWNSNGSLGQLAITDTVSGTSDSQTCNYTHDDLARIASVSCGSSIWAQTFGYDVFGNISKSGSSSFLAGYVLANGSTNNQIQSLPGVTVAYDADGRLTNDGTHSYGWDAEGKMVSVDSTTITFDALGRMVEKSVSGTYTQIVYGPLGAKYATMSAQTLQKGFVPLPLGSTAVYTSSGLAYYRHKDHLGSSRFASTPSRTMYSSTAYAPYGEPYKQAGTTDLSYTGQDQDTVSGMHDFLDRRFMTVQGRWLSPDPMGIGAVDPTNPQTWNRYAYVTNNPMAMVDPFGDDGCYDPDGNDVGVAQVNCYTAGGQWLGGGAYVVNGQVYLQSEEIAWNMGGNGQSVYAYNVKAGSFTDMFGYLFQSINLLNNISSPPQPPNFVQSLGPIQVQFQSAAPPPSHWSWRDWPIYLACVAGLESDNVAQTTAPPDSPTDSTDSPSGTEGQRTLTPYKSPNVVFNPSGAQSKAPDLTAGGAAQAAGTSTCMYNATH